MLNMKRKYSASLDICLGRKDDSRSEEWKKKEGS